MTLWQWLTQTRHLGKCYSRATSKPWFSVSCQQAWGGTQGAQTGLMGPINIVGNYFAGDVAFCMLVWSLMTLYLSFCGKMSSSLIAS